MRIDGVPHLEIDGDFVTIEAERHSGRLSQYPRAIPEPGVNKKPRGRTVPTKESGEREGTTYTCRVCRKAFTRSEHMKRHIRSLHMHMEGTYMCSLPFCKKSFARRDNLIQHERKHKQLGAFHDCTKNFEGEIFPSLLPFYASREHRADLNVVINETDAYFEEWENKSIEWPAERPKSYGRLASASPLCDDDGIPKGERYRIMREEKVVAEVLAATEAEAEARKADLEKALLGQPPAIGTSRSMPLRSKPVFPTDFYYGEVVPGRSTK
ncbi:uncharacterized protein C8Q71DRAFT_716812 [Rhodofomes roseus]|uniref:C2H2-type domain-containing protein n=1 Tax=Rhodofomes roseus TaxID=34475 RepID=A0ABQ8K178_9APHY|nr:uncharacterized protein C8Q71DRAFT_716812 [Rhodofomes roseus]KAH9830468.1 hypothetical protein C8Q71DRAFT_716812 [Rhodofomes roseus]